MNKTQSEDGTTIAYDGYGSGPLAVIVGGAFNDRRTWAELAQRLASAGFTAVSYDRRGRGDSGDTPPYAVEREIEDLTAVIRAARGGPAGAEPTACVHAMSSGGALALRAAAAGAPISRLSVMEPPYRLPGGPPLPPGYLDQLLAFNAAGERGEAVEYFMTRAVGQPQAAVDEARRTPMWAWLEGLAPTLAYDAVCLGGNEQGVPAEMLASIRIPVLAVDSTGSAPFLRDAAAAVADAVPGAVRTSLEGGFHEVPVETLAPALAAFYTKE
jgi:pimeloyl-ACP methyl ester carboxylesterase